MMGTNRDQGLLTAALSQAGTLAPSASEESFVAQEYVDSPPEQPPRARRRTAAGAAATKQSPGLVIHTNAIHTGAAAPAAAAAAAVVGDDSIRVADDTVADGDAAVAADAVSHKPERISPAVHYLNGIRQCVNARLNKDVSQPSAGVTQGKNIAELVTAGEEFWSVLEGLKEGGFVRFDINKHNTGGRELVKSGKKDGIKYKDYMWQLDVVLNEGGQQLSEAEWVERSKSVKTMMTSDMAVTSDKAVTSNNAANLDFELTRSEPAVRIKAVYREKHDNCYALGGISTGRLNDVKDSSKLVAFRQAIFRITVIMMILWHSQGRPLAKHPSLEALKETYQLKAFSVESPSDAKIQ